MNIRGSFSRQVGIRPLDSRHSDCSDPKHWEIGLLPGEALVSGDLRVLTPDQLGRVKKKMLPIVNSGNLGAAEYLSCSDTSIGAKTAMMLYEIKI